MNVKTLSTLLAIVFVVVAAGCGGGNSDKKANEAYASAICTAVGTWTNEIKSLTTVPSGGISKSSLQQKLTQFQTATKTLVSQIKAVPPPNTSEGQAAKKQIDQLATQVQTTTTAVKSATAKLPANATLAQIVQALSGLVPQFQTLRSTAQSTIKTIESAGGSLGSAFKNERSCRQLG